MGEFIRSQPTNESYSQAWALLVKRCQLNLIEVIDHYERIYTCMQPKNTAQNYHEAFSQLQRKINQAVVMLISA